MNTQTFAAQATGAEPAGGAAAGEAIGATAAAAVATALIALLISWHRSGRIDWLARGAAAARRATGLPEWAALPVLVLNVSLLTAVLGMYWDISLHIDNGRDPGPLANPAHYLILVGLYGVLLAGVLSAVLAADRPSRTAISLGAGWWAPVGGALIAVCGAFALSGFPLDDLWHRLFGQDVTLWGPTHLMLIGGASLATLGALALQSEAIGELGRDPERSRRGAGVLIRRSLLAGSFLVALSTFQGEFDFGVPQFREVLQPVLIMLAAGIGLVTARIYLGRGGALMAVLGFLVIRGLVALMVGVVWGQTTPHFPLYLAEAVLVEAAFAGAARRSPVATGAIAGVLIGTVGLAAEWGWSHVWMPLPWTASLLPEAAIAGFVTAVAAGALGGYIGGSLLGPTRAPGLPRLTRGARQAALAALLVLVAVIAWGLPMASVSVTPRDSLEGANFANVTAWQGGGRVLSDLRRVAPGVYRTTEPVPVHDGWKSMVRVQTGDSLVAVPIYMPRDSAIPAPEVPARPAFTRSFVRDVKVLQREQKDDVPGGLKLVAYLAVGGIAAAMIALIAWVLIRLDGGVGPRRAKRVRNVSETSGSLAGTPSPR